jgi:TPR repeat protein
MGLGLAKGQDNRILTFQEAKALADEGNAYGEAIVAFHYSAGWQTEKNPELAAKYALSSTQKGHPLGAFRLGSILRSGDGVQKNENQGLELQKRAFQGLNNMSGNPYAITALGVILFQGKVVPENKKEAARLYKIAADMGFAPAQFNFAMCTELGHGISKDPDASKEYIRKALYTGYPPAQKHALEQDNASSNARRVGSNLIEGIDGDGRWAYEFIECGPSSEALGSINSIGGKLFEDEEWIVYASPSPAAPGSTKTDISVFDARSLCLQARIRIPNVVIGVNSIPETGELYFLTSTPGKYHYDDCPLALVLVDPKKFIVNRLALITDDYWLALREPVAINWQAGNFIVHTKKLDPKSEYAIANDCVSSIGNYKVMRREDWESLSQLNKKRWLAKDTSENLKASIAVAAIPITNHEDKVNLFEIARILPSGGIQRVNFSNLATASTRVAAKNISQIGFFGNNHFGYIADSEFHVLDSENSLVAKYGLDAMTPLQENESIRKSHILYGKEKAVILVENSYALIDSNAVEGDKSAVQIVPNGQADFITCQGGEFFKYVVERTDTGGEYDFGEYFLQRYDLASGKPNGVVVKREVQPKDHYPEINDGMAPKGWRVYCLLQFFSLGGISYSIHVINEETKQDFIVIEDIPSMCSLLSLEIAGSKARLIYGFDGQTVCGLVDIQTGRFEILEKWQHDAALGAAYFIPEAKTLLIPCSGGYEAFKCDGLKAPTFAWRMYLGGDGDFGVLLPTGVFAGSPGCEHIIQLPSKDGKLATASLAPWRNRPAEVLKTLNGNSEQIEVLARVTERWHKRIGFDPALPEPKASDFPTASVAERPPLWAKGEIADFSIQWQQGASPLKNVIVRVNGVESLRYQGSALVNEASSKCSVHSKVTLAQGENWIEVAAEDMDGRRSEPQRFRTILSEAAKPTKRYIISIGVSNYRDSALKLEFAAKDATDLSAAIKESTKGETEVLVLTNEQATQDAPDKIREFLANTTENDEVVVFCAGHGVLDSNLDYVYASHEFDSGNPTDTGIKLDDLVDAIGSSKSLKRLLLLDTCHSGQVGEKEEMLLAQMDTDLPKGVRAVKQRGMSVKPVSGLSAEGQQRFIEEMFLLPGLHRGINIIGASGGAEFALESAQWNNGVFTATIIEALRDKKADLNNDARVSVSELRDYLGQRVSELTKGAQKPSVVAAERDQDFDLVRAAYKKPLFAQGADLNESKPSAHANPKSDKILEFQVALSKAHAGNAYAQAVVSIYYGLGFGCEQDFTKSKEYVMLSAKQQNPLGIFRLAEMRDLGQGMDQNKEQAAQLMQKAKSGLQKLSGDPYAMTALAAIYERENPASPKARELLAKSAEMGYEPAAEKLSNLEGSKY